MYRYARSFALLLGATLALGACDDSPTGLKSEFEMAALAGDYTASGPFGAISFTTVQEGETTDWLAAGASLKIRLTADGKTTGRVFVPGADEDGGDFDEDLTGTWTLKADTVYFKHEADTFIRDMPFLLDGKRLVGDRSFDDARVRVELQRQ